MNINGVLFLNKLVGNSSNKDLQIVKKLFNADKAGHTGTLDPLASGLLPICFGEATKFSSFLFDFNKEYLAVIKLGESTTTYDREGDVTFSGKVSCDLIDIEKLLKNFLGEIEQTPPIYSALKVNGKPLYKYARNNIDIEIKSRKVHIYSIKIIDYKNSFLTISVLCSKGTYIRSLVSDIGLGLGCGAYLFDLTRTKIGNFNITNSFTIEELKSTSSEILPSFLLNIDILVNQFPKLELSQLEFNKIKNGIQVVLGESFLSQDSSQNEIINRLYYKNNFLGLGLVDQNYKLLKVKRLINFQNQIFE